jgi:benzil reductase ((S)-benzoin forming)
MHLYFITGSSSGLGKALAEQCLAEGHTVVGFSRSNVIVHEHYLHVSVDLGRQENLESFSFPEIGAIDSFNRIVLINNAAQIKPVKYIGKAETKDIITSFTLNLIATVVLTNSFLRTFETLNAEKLVINISSGAGKNPLDGWSTYCSAKAGLDMYTRVAALEREMSGNGFKMVSIAPGVVDTLMQAEIRNTNQQDFSEVERFVDYKAKGVLVSAEEAASKILGSVKYINDIAHEVYSVKN